MDELINRQAAINELKREAACGDRDCEKGLLYAADVLELFPSAQPEIIYCKDCKYQNKGSNESESWDLCGYRPWLHVPTEDEHYCGYAERRTDESD